MKKINFLLFITFTVLVINCKKDVTSSKKDLLSGKSWILTAETVSPGMNIGDTLITDLFSQLDDCDKDDIGKFNSNGTYTLEEGQTKCNVNDPQVYETGTWTLNSDETILVITSSISDIINEKIKELTANKLIVTEEETNMIDGITYTLTITYKTI